MIWQVANAVALLVSSRKRSLNDLIGGTVVVHVIEAPSVPVDPVAA